MQIVPAPGTQFKHYSMWIGIFIAVVNAGMLIVAALGDTELLTPKTVLSINAALGALIIPAKLIMQNISVTNEEKQAIVTASATLPVVNGGKDITVKIGNKIVSN